MCAGDDRDKNLELCDRQVAAAASAGAEMVVLPENFAYLGHSEGDRMAAAELLDEREPGPILAALKRMATVHGVWLVGGGMAERIPEREVKDGIDPDKQAFNTCVVVAPGGALVSRYRKIHLFDADIPDGPSLRESSGTVAGHEIGVCETPLARLGLTVCYDLRFPEIYRALCVHEGAELVVVPSAFTARTGAAHWHVLLRARAIENQCFIVAAAQVGQHNERRNSYGHALIVDPWGTILAEVEDGEGLAIADIDLALIEQTRQRMPCHQHAVLLPPERPA